MSRDKPTTNVSTSEIVEENDEFNLDFERLGLILPPEVWKIVTKHLLILSTDDLENLRNSSKFFQNLLMSQRTNYLFKNVFKLVTSSIWKNEGLKGLPVADVLKCRAVCSHWNAVIKKLIPENFQHFGCNTIDYDIGLAFKKIVTQKFYCWNEGNTDNIDESVHSFLRHFEHTHSKEKNPFIWGNLSIRLFTESEEGDDLDNYLRRLNTISVVLSKYGNHLHNISIYIKGYLIFRNVALLRAWFSEMSNLKKIRFETELEWRDDPDFILDEYLGDFPFPVLKHLETLYVTTLPKPVFNQLIRQNRHISTLTLNCDSINYDIFTFPLSNLRNLTLNYESAIFFFLVENLNSTHVQWPLETLTLSFIESGIITCAALFQVIQNKFANTLVSFNITMTKNKYDVAEEHVWQDCKNVRLNLPKLKNIKLDLFHILVCLDFLLPMEKNLEQIHIFAAGWHQINKQLKRKTANEAIVKFSGYETDMQKSNIWMLFKKLKKIGVREWGWEPVREKWWQRNEYVQENN